MSCPREPACLCCQASKPCAHVLQLDSKQQAQLARVLELVGENPGRGKYTRPIAVQAGVVADGEPVTEFECGDCGRVRTQYTYIAEFLATHHVKQPSCPVCAAARIAA